MPRITEKLIREMEAPMPGRPAIKRDDRVTGFAVRKTATGFTAFVFKAVLDPPSPGWLGLHSSRERVRLSGLWNQRHVHEDYDPVFLFDLERLISIQ